MQELLRNGWSEEDHKEFYRELKGLSKSDQSSFILLQASHLAKIADKGDETLLKAAESLVTFWITSYSNSAEKGQADYLLNHLQQRLNEL